MCGRTALTASPAELRETFGLDETPSLTPRYNVPPSRSLDVLRVVRGSTGRKLEALRWGLVPTWAKDPKIGNKLTLARAETVATTGAFRDAFRWRRCLVAVDGFYEWQSQPSHGTLATGSRRGKRSSPFFVRRADRRPFALAGLWSRWTSADGEVTESCAIVTQAAQPPLDAIHDRMPLVLEHDAWARWLDPELTEAAALAPLLVPRAPDLIAYAVSDYANDTRHDDPSCLEPATPVAQQSLF
jgi:putative SOS response-associated peptidase YedK